MSKKAGKKIVVTTTVYGEHSEALTMLRAAGYAPELVGPSRKTKISENELIELLREADGVIAGTEPHYSAKLFASCPRLKFVSRVGIGLDGIDFAAAKNHGVEFAYTPDAVTRPVAELVIGLIIGLGRRVALADRDLRGGKWGRHVGPELCGRTAGVIGFGRVGKLVAELLRAFGMKVLVNDLKPDTARAAALGVQISEKDEIFRSADFVTLHVPHTSLTHYLISSETLRKMKTTAILINTSRGPVVNTTDLARALKEGVIAGAALDVFEEEPYRGELTSLDNVLLTCHMGSCSDLGRKRMEEESAQNLVDFFDGKPKFGRVPDEARNV